MGIGRRGSHRWDGPCGAGFRTSLSMVPGAKVGVLDSASARFRYDGVPQLDRRNQRRRDSSDRRTPSGAPASDVWSSPVRAVSLIQTVALASAWVSAVLADTRA